MDFFSDLLLHLKPLFSGAYSIVTGQFLPSTCTWCRPVLWISEIGVVGFVVMYFSPQGPHT